MSKQPKYKVGEMVRVMGNSYYEQADAEYIKIKAMSGKICEIRFYDETDKSYGVYTPGKSNWWRFNESDLAPVKKTLRDMNAGDIIVSEGGDETRVLAVLAKIFFYSAWDSFNESGSWRTFDEAEELGWKLKDTPQETITINNKTYRKEDVIERLVGLEEA